MLEVLFIDVLSLWIWDSSMHSGSVRNVCHVERGNRMLVYSVLLGVLNVCAESNKCSARGRNFPHLPHSNLKCFHHPLFNRVLFLGRALVQMCTAVLLRKQYCDGDCSILQDHGLVSYSQTLSGVDSFLKRRNPHHWYSYLLLIYGTKPLKNFDRPLMRVYLSDSILVTLIFFWRQSDGWLSQSPHESTKQEIRYYKDVNMPINFCSEAYFFRLDVL